MAGNSAQDDFVKNMDKLAKIVEKPMAAGARALSPSDICKAYAKAKPIIESVLPVLAVIPVVSKIVPVIKLLMGIADTFCASA
jgi:hypothetical protein